MIKARKISFREAWDSSVVFLVDEALEKEIENKVEELLEEEQRQRAPRTNANDLAKMLAERKNALDVILKDLELSAEKFMRIISLLRKLRRIPGGFDKEWGINKINSKIKGEPDFARLVASLLFDGKRDEELKMYVPRYYLDSLDYRGIQSNSQANLRKR